MQFTKIMVAVATMAVGAAMAAPATSRIAISSGASASKNNLKLALQNICAGTLTEFTDGTANVSTYVCATGAVTSGAAGTYAGSADASFTNFTGTSYAELRLNVNGGSFTAACLLAGWPVGTKCPAPDNYVNPASDVLATLEAAPSGSAVIGGLMDVEPGAFVSTVRAGIANPPSVVSAGFGQTFGVAVSNTLYAAMFADQQLSGKLPASPTCDISMTSRPECVPVIGKAQMASLMSANSGSAAYINGANFLAPSQRAAGAALTYARRVDTSGTQAAAQEYFLGNVCNSAGVAVVAEGASAGAITVLALPTTGGVRGQLNGATDVIGIMSGENNQTGQTWKWLRVGGMNMAESAAPAEGGVTFTNSASSLDGRYDYWFLSRIAKPAGAATTNPNRFWTAVISSFGTVPVNNTKGLFKTSETLYSRGTSNSCQPVVTN